jgi:hypothetical protein
MSLPSDDEPQRADPAGWVVGWKLDRYQRRELLMQFPPVYAQPVADHVTLKSRVGADAPLPSATTGEIVGRADDGSGVEALVVEIEDTSARPGGGTFHITWSLGEGRAARESNDVLAGGWTPLDLPMPVLLVPACWPRRAS